MNVNHISETRIARPTNPYDPAWIEYWRQNPNLKRSVGAEGDDNAGDNAGDKSGGGGADDHSGDSGREKPNNDGKPSDKEAKLLKEVMQKKEKIESLTGKIAELEAKLKNVDLDEYQTLKAEQAKAAAEKAKQEEELALKRGEFDRLRAKMAEEHTKEKSELAKQIEAANEALKSARSTIEDLTVGQSFANSAFIQEDLVLTPAKARVVYGPYFEIEDGRVVGYDKPRGAAERTKMVDGKGEPLPFEVAIKRIIDADPDKEKLLKSKLKPGSDSAPASHKKETPPAVKGLSRIQAALSQSK